MKNDTSWNLILFMDDLAGLDTPSAAPCSLVLKERPAHGPVVAVSLAVLQFVPQSVDTGFCNFTQRIEKGLLVAFSEVRKHRPGTYNFTVQVRTALRAGQDALAFGAELVS